MNKRISIKVGIAAVLFSGILLCLMTITNTVTLGPYIASQSRFPLLETVSRINIGNFIQRLDSLAIVILMIGGYVKIGIFTAASVLGFVSINQNKQPRNYILPVSIIMAILSIVIADNLIEHLQFGLKVVPWMLHIPFQFGIPAFLCLIVFIKNQLKKRALKDEMNA